MNRLDKKCFIAAASTHGLLFLILIIGPAFFVSQERHDNNHIKITIYDAATLSDAKSSGGSPQVPASAPAPAPKTPLAQVEPPAAKPVVEPPKIPTPPVKVKDLEPVEPKLKIKSSPDSLEPAPKKKHQVVLSADDFTPTS